MGFYFMDKDQVIDAVQDMLAGWKYIRSTHGDLYGVGWQRAQDKMEQALLTLIQDKINERTFHSQSAT